MSELRRRILIAAADLFARDGFDGATMAGIASASGLSLKALYGAFPSKEELFEAVLADRYESHVLPVLLRDRTALPHSERVFSLLDNMLAAMELNLAFLYSQCHAGVPAKFRANERDPYAPYLNAFRDHLVEAIGASRNGNVVDTVDDLAIALTASLVALATSAFAAEPPRPPSEVSAVLRSIFGPALGVPQSASSGCAE